jgi:hypothetical protein
LPFLLYIAQEEEYNEFQIAKVIAVNASFKDSSYIECINTFLDMVGTFNHTNQEDQLIKHFNDSIKI